jgi:hypothetical protein
VASVAEYLDRRGDDRARMGATCDQQAEDRRLILVIVSIGYIAYFLRVRLFAPGQ